MNGITGAVLAGGESRRFGSNKAFAPWNGRPMVESVVETLADVFASNLVLVKDPEPFGFLNGAGVRVVEDLIADAHSMGGIWSGLTHAGTGPVFVCACDMPFLQPRLIRGLCEASPGHDAVIPVWRGKPQPLCGIYSGNCRRVLGRLIRERRFRIRELFGLIHTRFYAEREVEALDPAGLSFVDLDTPEEYEDARRAIPC